MAIWCCGLGSTNPDSKQAEAIAIEPDSSLEAVSDSDSRLMGVVWDRFTT